MASLPELTGAKYSEMVQFARHNDAASLSKALDAHKIEQAHMDGLLWESADFVAAPCVKLLLARGANPNARGPQEETPLFRALTNLSAGCVETIEALLPVSNLKARNNEGLTLAQQFISQADGAFDPGRPESAQAARNAVKIIQLLAPVADFTVPFPGKEGRTALHFAAQYFPNESVFRAVFGQFSDPDARDESAGRLTPLMHAASHANVEAVRVLASVADFDARAASPHAWQQGETAMEIALARLKAGSSIPNGLDSRDFAVVEALANGRLSAQTRAALRKHGEQSLPGLAALAEREELKKSLAPSAAERVFNVLSGFAGRLGQRRAADSQLPHPPEHPAKTPDQPISRGKRL